FQWVSDEELAAPVEASQPLEQEPPSPDYVPGPEHPPSPNYVSGPVHPPSPDYIPGYVADSDLEEDLEEDPADYLVDGGDDKEEEESKDDGDDEDEEEYSKDKDEEEEHLALTNSTTLPVVDPVPSAEDTEAFETDE
ncbi:hypothetical protein Tco_0687698, partial [Tanacetum coccineum]